MCVVCTKLNIYLVVNTCLYIHFTRCHLQYVCKLWGCINVKTTKSIQVCAADQVNTRVKDWRGFLMQHIITEDRVYARDCSGQLRYISEQNKFIKKKVKLSWSLHSGRGRQIIEINYLTNYIEHCQVISAMGKLIEQSKKEPEYRKQGGVRWGDQALQF